jgi:hypothetical protein
MGIAPSAALGKTLLFLVALSSIVTYIIQQKGERQHCLWMIVSPRLVSYIIYIGKMICRMISRFSSTPGIVADGQVLGAALLP